MHTVHCEPVLYELISRSGEREFFNGNWLRRDGNAKIGPQRTISPICTNNLFVNAIELWQI